MAHYLQRVWTTTRHVMAITLTLQIFFVLQILFFIKIPEIKIENTVIRSDQIVLGCADL